MSRTISFSPAIALLVTLALILSIATTRVSAEQSWQSNWPSGQPTNQITALAISPTDGQSVYASTPEAVYRSTDGGASWTNVSSLANVVAMAVDPSSRDIVYAYCWSNHESTPRSPRGLRKSTDGGRNWSDPTGGSSANTIGMASLLIVDPANPQTLLAGTSYHGTLSGRILRSTDGGASWLVTYDVNSMMGVGGMSALAIHPTAPNVVYAAHDVYHGGLVLRSDDSGANWRALAHIPEPLSNPAALALHPTNPDIAYVVYQAPMGYGVSIHRTTNGGASWTKLNPAPVGSLWGPHLLTDPRDPNELYLSLQGDSGGVYRSSNAGDSWIRLSPEGDTSLSRTTALVYNPANRMIYAGTSQGVWNTQVLPAIAEGLRGYYDQHDGWRVMGRPISSTMVLDGWLVQYFEKGRLEDHSQAESDPNWKYMYGLLVDQLQQASANLPVGGDTSTVSYADIHNMASPNKRLSPPWNFISDVQRQSDGSVFIPYDAHLRREAGHTVPDVFWKYINRTDLFPGGWLHDIGLPMTEAFSAVVDKGEAKGRQILIQAFQRTILTYDPLNPADWQVERANVGTDYAKAFLGQVSP